MVTPQISSKVGKTLYKIVPCESTSEEVLFEW